METKKDQLIKELAKKLGYILLPVKKESKEIPYKHKDLFMKHHIFINTPVLIFDYGHMYYSHSSKAYKGYRQAFCLHSL